MKRITLSLLMLFCIGMLTAQTNSYTLYFGGTVKDPKGAPVPHATIVIMIPATSATGFSYAAKVQTNANGVYEHKVIVPNSTPQGVVHVVLYNCDNKEILQKGVFGIGAPNKFEFHFAWCKAVTNIQCAVAIAIQHSPDASHVVLKAEAKGHPPFNFEWSDGQKGQTIKVTPTPNTKVCVTVTDFTKCTATNCVVFQGPKCGVVIHQSLSGELVAKVEGKGPFTYIWSTNATTQGIKPDGPGEYCVEIKTSDGCQAKACFKVGTVVSQCAVEIGVAPASSTNAGWKLTAHAKGSGKFQYFWSNENGKEGTESITVTQPGNYCVTVLDASGCKSYACKVIGVETNCKVGIEPGKDEKGNIVKLTAVPSIREVSYFWSTGETTQSIKTAGPGKYCVTITDGKTCKAFTCFEIPAHPPACKVEIKQTASGELVAVVVGNGPFKYHWNNGQTTQGIKPGESGEFCVEVTNEKDCKARACIKVGNPDAPCAVEIGVIQNSTVNDPWILKAYPKGVAPFKFFWSNQKEGVDQITVSTPGNYCVTILDAAGCKSVACKTLGIEQNCRVGIEPGKDEKGNIVKLTAVPSIKEVSYFWSTGETTQSIKTAGPGKYCVTITDGKTCKAFTCFEIPAHPPACRVEIKQTASGELVAHVTGSGNYKFSWSTGDITRAILPKAPGEYCVKVTNGGCIASACFKVLGGDVKCAAEISVTPGTTPNAAWKLTVHAKGTAPFKYLWNFENASTESITVSRSGTYCVTVTDATGCSTKICRTVGLDASCKVGIEVLKDPASNAVILKAIAPGSNFTYKWSTGETTPFIILNPALSMTYCVTVTNSAGCEAKECIRFEGKMSELNYTIQGFVTAPTITTALVTLKGKASLYYLNQPTASSILVMQVPLQPLKEGKPNYYSFGRLPAGRYLVRITLESDSPHFKDFLPTYYGNVIQWNASSVIPIPNGGGSFDVTLVQGSNAEGPGNITGSVRWGSGLTTASDDGYRGGDPVKDVTLLLTDSHDNPLYFTETSDKGEFNFRGLPYGTYKVMIERVGFETEWKWVTISAQTPQVSNLNFTVPENTTLTSVKDAAAIITNLVAYPNPVSSTLKVQIDALESMATSIRISAISGKTLYSEKFNIREGRQNLEIDLSSIPSGIYFLSLTNGQNVITTKVIKE